MIWFPINSSIYEFKVCTPISLERGIHGPQLNNEYKKEAIYPPIKPFKNKTEEEEVSKWVGKSLVGDSNNLTDCFIYTPK